MQPVPSDPQLLYGTLVDDGAQPDGFLSQFVVLMAAVEPATARQARATFLDNAQADLIVHEYHKNKSHVEAQAKTAADVFAQAVAFPPRRFKTRLGRTLVSGPTLRKDAEELESSRWIHTLATLLMDTPTPIGQILKSNPSDCQHLRAGKRASTLRSLVRYSRNFMKRLSSAHQKVYLTEVADFIQYLKVRRGEPCNRGALRNTRRSTRRVCSSACWPVWKTWLCRPVQLLTCASTRGGSVSSTGAR